MSSDITVGIMGMSEFGNMYEYSKDYDLGDQNIWAKNVIGAEYICHGGDVISGLFYTGVVYNYKVAHADNVFTGTWTNYLL